MIITNGELKEIIYEILTTKTKKPMTHLQQIQKRRSFFKKQISTIISISIDKRVATGKEVLYSSIIKFFAKKLLAIHDKNSEKFGLKIGCKHEFDFIDGRIVCVKCGLKKRR